MHQITSGPAGLQSSEPEHVEHLYATLQPQHYDVYLQIDPRQPAFAGKVGIAAHLAHPTNKISLHALGLQIHSASVNEQMVDISKLIVEPDEKHETITLVLDQPVSAGEVHIDVAYSGKFDAHLEGLYRTSDSHDGQHDWSAVTQGEPTLTRKYLPCVDEPQAKATFDVTITAPADKTVLSNMPARERHVEGTTQIVRFARTPKMSTYLLALTVARLASKCTLLGNRTLAIWAPPEKLDQVDYALEAAKRAVEYFEQHTGVPYPLPKLDLLLVSEFRAGAMENWGLITFRDMRLLVHPTLSSVATKKGVKMVVAHEVSHMWWGDLVTMAW